MKKDYYELKVAGLNRKLPKIKISQELTIASFVILGDTELVVKCAKELRKKIPEIDFIVTAEAKGIPLAHELSKELDMKRYIVIRKSVKSYMGDPISVPVKSITTEKDQNLYLDSEDIKLIKNKKVAIVDDVISTGKSVEAMEKLLEAAGANVVCKVAILAEGDASKRDDIIYLEYLPVFENE